MTPRKPPTSDTGVSSEMQYDSPTLGGHVHTDSRGYVHWCYHHCRNILTAWQFWLGMTLSFPFEHLLWEKMWPFYLLSHWLGL